MGEVAVNFTASTHDEMTCGNSSAVEAKRGHELGIDDAEQEMLPNKRQAIETSNSDPGSEVLDGDVSVCENASSCHIVSTELGEQLAKSETTSTADLDKWNSTMESVVEKEHCRNDSSVASSSDPLIIEDSNLCIMYSGNRKIRFRFSRRRDSINGKSTPADTNLNKKDVSQPSYCGSDKPESKLSERLINGCDTSTSESPGHASGALDVEGCPISSEETYLTVANQAGALGTKISQCSHKENMEIKMSKKVKLNSFATNAKRLLSTGLLEGVHVKYISWARKKVLSGIIKDRGYLCGCPLCNFSDVVGACEFEQHASCSSKHPNTHIYLSNGKTIHGIVQELKSTPIHMLDEVISSVISSPNDDKFLTTLKETFPEESFEARRIGGNDEKNEHSCSQLSGRPYPIMGSPSEDTGNLLGSVSGSMVECLPVEQKNSTMLKKLKGQRWAVKRLKGSDMVFEPKAVTSKGTVQRKKITHGGGKKRDNDLHRLVFMANGLPDGTELAYYSKGQRLLEGYKQGNGIFCSCCSNEISPSQFEAHAGWATRRQPYRHIYVSNGLSLHDISISLSNGQDLATVGGDDMCAVCGDGGELLLCDGCPRSFHAACLELQCVLEGKLFCPYCKDEFDKKVLPGEISPAVRRPLTIRLKRVVEAPPTEIGGCVVCRGHDFSNSGFDDQTVMLCDQCGKEFHVGCLRDSDLCDLKELPEDEWFCCKDCNRINVSLHNLVSIGAERIPSSFLCPIKKKIKEKGLPNETGENVQWQLLSGKIGSPDDKSLLSKAAAIFRDCFDPIVVESGRDLVPAMVYGRNIGGREFGGMHCAILIVNSNVVSAGLLRIFGLDVAELPLVATRKESQGKGYFQLLFSCIERLLSCLRVRNLVLPAAEEAKSIWTNKLGFKKMTEEHLQKYARELQLTFFQGTSMLEKAIPVVKDVP